MKPKKSAFKGKKRGFVATIKCPSCAKTLEVMKEEEIIRPAVTVEKRVTYYAEESNQTQLPVADD